MPLPTYRWRFVHLAALWAYGVGQPVFSMLKGNPEFLVVRGTTRADLVAFAMIVAFAVPLVVVGLQFLIACASETVAEIVHVVALVVFGTVVCLQVVKHADLGREPALLVPMIPAVTGTLVYLRSRAFRTFLSVSFALPVVGLVAFVLTAPLATNDRRAIDVEVDSDTPVVLLVLDEFATSSLITADGVVDAQRYPNFARLAATATWYPRATTVHEHSTQAVPAILTGRSPHRGELPTLADHPGNLFTLLGERYELHVREQVTRLCPSRYCPDAVARAAVLDRHRDLLYDVGVGYLYRVLPQSLHDGLPSIGGSWGGFSRHQGAGERLLVARNKRDVDLALEQANPQPGAFSGFLDGFGTPSETPTLDFLHLLLPHTPWRFLPSGRTYGNSATIDGIHDDAWNRWEPSSALVEQALQRHLLQVGYTDRLVGRLIARLEAVGLYDRALLIVTADHGVSFEPGGSRRLVTRGNLADIASVPLFVKYPGQADGRVDRRAAKTIDVVATIADVLGVSIPWQTDGRSLRRPASGVRRVSVARRDGGAVTAAPGVVFDSVLETARRNASLFGEGHESMYRLGDRGDLLGRHLGNAEGAVFKAADIRLDGGNLLASVNTRSRFVPARIVGEIRGWRGWQSEEVAVAVNRRIVALTRAYELDGRVRFAALVPEAALRDGWNRVDVYSVSGGPKGVQLIHLGDNGMRPEYRILSDRDAIVLPDLRTASIEPGRIAGRVERWNVSAETVRIRGWAADLRGPARADRVLVFADDRLVFAGDTTVYRWDIAETVGLEALKRSGWVAEVPLRDVQGADVRVFAVGGTVASELEWPGDDHRVTSSRTSSG